MYILETKNGKNTWIYATPMRMHVEIFISEKREGMLQKGTIKLRLRY